MGLIRFLIDSPSRLTAAAVQRAYFSGPDYVPWPTRARLTLDGLEVDRDTDESGNLHLLWNVPGQGELVLTTGTLCERGRPYWLLVELARGKLSQLRAQAAEWQELGLVLPDDLQRRLHEATLLFALAATKQHLPHQVDEYAEQALAASIEAGERLVACFAEQALAARKRQSHKLATWLGIALGDRPVDSPTRQRLPAAFNAAAVSFNWHAIEASEGVYHWEAYDQQVEMCEAQGLKIAGGPLLKFGQGALPDWLYLWSGDYENLLSVITDFVETTLARYRGRVQLWNCAARLSEPESLGLSEEQRFQLAVRVVEIVRRMDPDTPAVISFDQPWGEYIHRSRCELAPLTLADALVRSELGLSGIALECNVGYVPGGTIPRDLLTFNRLVDWWASLGLPLYFFVSFPSSAAADPASRRQAHVSVAAHPAGATPAGQLAWIERFIPALVAKPAVRGVFWNQWTDAEPHDFPHGGLVDANGAAKPALEALAAIRRRHLA